MGAAKSYIYILPGFELPTNLHHKYLEEGEGAKEMNTLKKNCLRSEKNFRATNSD